MVEEKKVINSALLRLPNSGTKVSDLARIQKILVLTSAFAVACLVMYLALLNDFSHPRRRFSFSSFYSPNFGTPKMGVEWAYDDYELRELLNAASMEDKTVILTTLNEAWAKHHSIFDYFVKSFKIGNNTNPLLKHVVVICYDQRAYARCRAMIPHCYFFNSQLSQHLVHEARFMSPVYMDMMWERLAFLHVILSIGYNFVYTDTDVMWLRDPFPYFFPKIDIQTSCDRFNGRYYDWNNYPNNGFTFVRSNSRTVEFYKYWLNSRLRFPHLHEQDAFTKIKYDPFVKQIGLKIRFLDTDHFGGFCRPSKDFNKVCTMHANCCVGLDKKLADLNTTLLDWERFILKRIDKWRVPHKCRRSLPKPRARGSFSSSGPSP